MVVGQPQHDRHRPGQDQGHVRGPRPQLPELELAAAAADLRRLRDLGDRRDDRAARSTSSRAKSRSSPATWSSTRGWRSRCFPRRVRRTSSLVSALASVMFLGGWFAPISFALVGMESAGWIASRCGSGTGLAVRRDLRDRDDVPLGRGHLPALPLRPDHAARLEDLHSGDAGLARRRWARHPVALDIWKKAARWHGNSSRTFSRASCSASSSRACAHRPPLPVEEGDGAVPGGEVPLRRAFAACTRCAATRTARSAASPASCARRSARRWRSRSRATCATTARAARRATRSTSPSASSAASARRAARSIRSSRPTSRIPRREARRPVLHQGHAARRRRPLRRDHRCKKADAKYR